MNRTTVAERAAVSAAHGASAGSPTHARALVRASGWLLLGVLVGLVLAYTRRAQIGAEHLEFGDLAANSILIQQAKSLGLWVGNYSRMGFNHPGPAILYFLAVGELVLHDWFHLVPSPLSGQMVAAAFYSALWITLLAALFRRSLSMSAAAIATTTFVLVAALLDRDFLGGMWFPHLYFFPFAVALVSFARLAGGQTDSLGILALACGFLINGHASFIVLASLMFGFVLAYNFAAYRGDPERQIAHCAFRARHAREIMLAMAVLGVFLVALVVMTVKAYPGPLYDYARFAGSHHANDLASALRFTSVYWGGPADFVIAMLVCVFLLWRKAGSALGIPHAREAMVAIFAATLATVFYAKFGVDMLDQAYLAFYYYAAPCLLAGLLATSLLKPVPQRWARPTGIIASALLAGATYTLCSRPREYSWDYHQESPRQVLQALEARKAQGRIVLDLDNTRADWSFVWATLVGAEVLGRRTHEDPFCIATGWHIVFTKEARCTPAEVASGEHFFVTQADPQPAPNEAFTAGGLLFRRRR